MEDILQMLSNFQEEVKRKEELIAIQNEQMEKLKEEISFLKLGRKDFENKVELKVLSLQEKWDNEKREINNKHEIEIKTLKNNYKKLDDNQLNERFKNEISLIRESFFMNYTEMVAKKVEEERGLIYDKLKEKFEKQLQEEKELLLKQNDLLILKQDVNDIKVKIRKYEDSLWDQTPDELQKFAQLIQSNSSFGGYRAPGNGNIYQVVNGWFNMHKCILPSFCKYMVIDVIREGQHKSCAQNMILNAKICPYIEWLNAVEIGRAHV